ncbi:MAG: Gldg family protein [Candidatus Omnitrophota bacterium]|nr:Gldg family protein [Candidatus Omnitrophota bacterium]
MKKTKRLLSSVNLLTTLALLGVLFIMVNFIASRRYARWDLTRQQLTALSDQTLQTLKSLKEPASVVIFYQPNHRLYGFVNDLLNEYARASPQLAIERVDPEQDVARARQLVQEFQIDVADPDALNLVIFKSGARHKYLSDTDLAEYDYGGMAYGGQPRVKAFTGEEAFTSALISVTQANSSLVWVTSGHGEKSLEGEDPSGLSDLKRALEQQNVSVQTVTVAERPAIDPEVKLIIIPGPTRRFLESEVALLEAYLQGGGRLLLLIDPLDDSGLDGLLERWGIVLGLDIVVDPSRQLPFVSAANLLVTTYTQHPIVEKMKTFVTLYPLARSVRPTQPVPEGLSVQPLALTTADGWGETQTATEAFEFTKETDLPGPVSIAAAAERVQPAQEGTLPLRSRLVVVGDSDFVINAQLSNAGNKDMALGAIRWLLEQEHLIGIGPKSIESIKLQLTGGQLLALSWFSFLALPAVLGLLGAVVWWLRRT